MNGGLSHHDVRWVCIIAGENTPISNRKNGIVKAQVIKALLASFSSCPKSVWSHWGKYLCQLLGSALLLCLQVHWMKSSVPSFDGLFGAYFFGPYPVVSICREYLLSTWSLASTEACRSSTQCRRAMTAWSRLLQKAETSSGQLEWSPTSMTPEYEDWSWNLLLLALLPKLPENLKPYIERFPDLVSCQIPYTKLAL